jgi:enamine deaminase RidA (YjgF/YER057c/UK114 family)
MTDEDLTYATAPHPYTPAVAAGDLVFVSGRVPTTLGKARIRGARALSAPGWS